MASVKFLEAFCEFSTRGVGAVLDAGDKIRAKLADVMGPGSTSHIEASFEKVASRIENRFGQTAGKIANLVAGGNTSGGGGGGATGGILTSILGEAGPAGIAIGVATAGVAKLIDLSASVASWFANAASSSFEWATHVERVRTTLSAIVGTRGAAAVMGAARGFEGTDISGESAIAAGRKLMQGMSGSEAAAELKKLGAVAALTGESIEGIASAYERARIRGQVTSRTLMGLGEELTDEIRRMHPELGSNLSEAADKGRISIAALDEAIDGMAHRGEMVLQAQQHTVSGQIAILSANIQGLFGEIAGGLMDALDVEGFLEVLNAMLSGIRSFAHAAIEAFKSIKDMVMPILAPILAPILKAFELFRALGIIKSAPIADEPSPKSSLPESGVGQQEYQFTSLSGLAEKMQAAAGQGDIQQQQLAALQTIATNTTPEAKGHPGAQQQPWVH